MQGCGDMVAFATGRLRGLKGWRVFKISFSQNLQNSKKRKQN